VGARRLLARGVGFAQGFFWPSLFSATASIAAAGYYGVRRSQSSGTGTLRSNPALPRLLPLAAGVSGEPGSPWEGGAALELRTQLARLDDRWKRNPGGGDMAWQEIEGSFVLLPPAVPWGVIHFTGGAVLGSYPHIVYNELFMRLCRRTGVAVVATPYNVGLDHRQLATDAAGAFLTTLKACQSRYGWSPRMPVFGMGHSLGAKLQLLLHRTDAAGSPPFKAQRIALMAYNNYDVTDSLRMLETFAGAFSARGAGGVDSAVIKGLLKVVETVTATIGLRFSPAGPELRAQVRESRGPDTPVAAFRFATDTLDCSESLAEDVPIAVVELPGDHLTPVFLRLDLRGTSGVAAASFASAAPKWEVGEEKGLQGLVEALDRWLTGRPDDPAEPKAYRVLPGGVIDV
jgi:hypothetical protein